MKALLALRKKMKNKKPDFIMQDYHKMRRLSEKWKKPRGIDSKMRLHLKGYSKSVEPGYRSPKAVRYLSSNGFTQNIVSNENAMSGLDKAKDGVIISAAVGKRRKVELITKAKQLGLTILNIKNADAYLASIAEDMKKRKEERGKRQKKKSEEKPKDAKKSDEKLAEKVMTHEEKLKEEKKETDKILTKKE
jgi:large subunit ribosomal protein L32e